jgi:hypothetical protein
MGNPTLGRDRTPCTSSPITHDASGARVMMVAEEVADVRGPGGQRKRIPHGNMRAKLLNYIGQIFECKADSPHYSPSPRIPPQVAAGSFIRAGASQAGGVARARREERDSRDGRDEGGFEPRNSRFSELRTPSFELRIAPFMPVSPVSLEQGIGCAAETFMSNTG